MARTPPRSVAQGLADHFNVVLNRTVTESRLTLVPIPGHDERFLIQRMVERRDAPLELRPNPLRLFVRQTIKVVGEHCQTVSYRYRLQAGDDPKAWALRWEYDRRPPKPDYPYVLGHVHVNGELRSELQPPSEELPHLHIATERVSLESVLHHLISEWGVETRDEGWRQVLDESRAGFHERRTAH